MYPPSEPPVDPLGLPPAPAAPTVPVAPTPKQMNPIIQSLLTAAAAMAGPGRGTGILQGLNLSQQQATQAAEQQHLRNQQDYARQVQAYQTEEQAWQRQQTQRAAMLQKVLADFQSELQNTGTETEADNLYQSAAQVLQAQGFRGFDVASLKRKYHSPTAQERAGKVVDKFLSGAAAKQTLENDPEALNSTYIDLGNGVMVPFQQAQAMSGRAPLKGKPKVATPRQPAAVGSFEDYVSRAYGDTPTAAQLLQARKAYANADNAPQAPSRPPERPKQVFVLRNGVVTPIEEGTAQAGDRPYNSTDAKMTATADDVRSKRTTLATNALDAIAELEKSSGVKGIFGAPQLTAPGSWVRMFGMDPIAGSASADAKGKLDRLLSLITLPELQNMRGLGAMSDREFATISKAATTLSTKMSDRAAAAELARLKKAFEAMQQRQSGTPVGDIGTSNGNGTVTIGGQTFGVQVVP